MSSDLESFKRLIDIGIALSAEKDTDTLMETILLEAKDIGNADGGTLYRRNKEDQQRNEKVNITEQNKQSVIRAVAHTPPGAGQETDDAKCVGVGGNIYQGGITGFSRQQKRADDKR